MIDPRISYRARAAVGIVGLLLVGLGILIALAAFGCAACWLWVALGLPA